MFKFFSRFFITFLASLFFLTPTFASTIARPILNNGLVGYWAFDEGVGASRAFDKSGYGNTGTLTNGPVSTTSNTGLGQALFFDASNDYVDAGSGSTLDNIGPMTVSAWYYARSEGENSRGGLFNKGDGNGAGVDGPHFEFGSVGIDAVDRTNAFAFVVPYSGTGLIRTASDNSVLLNRWQFVTVTWDGTTSASNVHIYIDGVEVTYQKTQNGVGTRNDDSGTNFLIGIGNFGAQSNTWDGSIDAFRVYNRVLSSNEIQRLYKLQQPRVSGGITSKGLVGYWNFEDGTGLRVEDSSNNNTTGTITNATWTTGKNGKALFFTGSSYVDLGNPSAINPTNAITISVWVMATTTVVNNDIISDDNGGTITYFLRINTSGNVFGRISGTTITGNTTLSPNIWYHLALVYDGANMYLYVNGISDATPVAKTGAIVNGGDSKNIGRRPGGSAYFNGVIDELRIYDRGLPQSEVYAMYKGSVVSVINKSKTDRLTNGLIGYWTFDGSKIAGVTAYDSGSGGNNGTMTNGPVPTLGKVGQALDFSKVDDYILVPSSTIYNNANMTICAWVYPTANVNSVHIASRLGVSASGDWRFGIGASGGTWRFRVQTSAGQSSAESSTGFTLNSWQHVCGVYNGSNVLLYVNGVQTNSVSNVGSMGSTSVDIWIGNASTNEDFTGKIDDVRLYSSALSDDEIKALYNVGK